MAGLASRVALEREVLRGEALRGTAAVRGARLVPMIGSARPLLVWWVQAVRGQFRYDWDKQRRRRRAGSLDLMASSSCACRKTRPTFSAERERPPAALPLVPHRYCGGRFSRTRGFSVAMRSPSATLSSGSSQKNVRTQLL